MFQPISEWTSAQVLEWMAATNLYLCSEIFRYKDIKGSDLVHLDKEKLIVSVYIRTLTHKKINPKTFDPTRSDPICISASAYFRTD